MGVKKGKVKKKRKKKETKTERLKSKNIAQTRNKRNTKSQINFMIQKLLWCKQ